MRKFILLLLSVLGVSSGVFAQSLANGYYRVTNAASDRYIQVLDNKGSLNMQTSSADMGAILLKKGIENSVYDPASVLYIEQHGSQYDIKSQSTGIFDMIGVYVNLIKSPSVTDAYRAFGKKGTMVMYLYDAKSNMTALESYLDTKGSSQDWFIYPIDTASDNYFGVKPTHHAAGKYYASMYAAFPFSTASEGMKVYYVTKVDEAQGVAVYKEITGVIPALTPVIIECSSDQPADNKLNIGGSPASVSGNIGKGVLFELHKYKHDNFVTYNKSTMRTIGIAADGSLAMTAGEYTDVPRNTFYLSVSASCPASLKLVHESQYQTGPVEATSIFLSRESLSLSVGASASISATVAPDNTTDKTVTWTSSNPAVASVDNAGNIKALSAGEAKITAKCGNVSASCVVTVTSIDATSVTLSDTSVELTVGNWTKLTATVAPDNATDKTITWTSSNPDVATVDKWGTIRAIAPGEATVTAACGDVQASCAVKVSPIEIPNIEVTSVTLSDTSVELTIGSWTKLTAIVAPDNATDKTVTWTSSNPDVATVDQWGTIRAIAPGEATVTASCGDVQATCAVKVSDIKVTSITLSDTSVVLTIGNWIQISATVAPDNATDKTVTWTSSDPDVATVDKWGTIRAIAPGEATVTASCGDVQSTCAVKVSDIKVTSITLSDTSVELTIGNWTKLAATVAPDNATDKTVTWTSSDPDVATVDKWGTIRAIAPGEATVTASCGDVQATCAVTVLPILAESITLNATSIEIDVPDTYQLKAYVAPVNTTDPTVAWTSSDPSVASVDDQGLVTAIAEGQAIITATCGDIKAECKVKVNPVDGIYDITTDGQTFDIYNLQGILIRSNATTLEGLPHGYYIINGHTIRH